MTSLRTPLKSLRAERSNLIDEIASVAPLPRNDDREPHPRNDDREPHPRNDDREPHPRNDDREPHPRNDDREPHPRNDGWVIMFWNVENYFDPFDDPATNDEDFVFGGKYRWSWSKFVRKRNSIAKTILSVKQAYGEYPMVVGLSEVENYMVLKQLIEKTPLSKLDYGVVHRDSPDLRGVDVAMIYLKSKFKPLEVRALNVDLKMIRGSTPTRDILYVKGVEREGNDTLHIFVNHWPSKLGGEEASLPKRMAAAVTLKRVVDSLGPERQIVIMGDFNDTPESSPVTSLRAPGTSMQAPVTSLRAPGTSMQAPVTSLRAERSNLTDEIASVGCASLAMTAGWSVSALGQHLKSLRAERSNLVNLATPLHRQGLGTIRYRGEWELIDQFIVSETIGESARMEIFSPEFLSEEDKNYLGKKPKRTHIGPQYNGGVSDHYPIVLLRLRNGICQGDKILD